MKYSEFVDKVSEYGWDRTRLQGHIASVVSSVVFVHRNKEWTIDRYYYLSDLKLWYHTYDVMFGHMKNYDLFTSEKLVCTKCGGKVHYNDIDPNSGVLYTMNCKCSDFMQLKGGKAKIPDYWVEAKKEEVKA